MPFRLFRSFALLLLAAVLTVAGCGKKKVDDADGGDGGASVDSGGDIPNPPRLTGPVTASWNPFEVDRAKKDSTNNLREIGRALHNFHDTNTFFPTGIYDKSGKKLGLSWRVAVLPFLNESELYKQFKLDEPWDGETNKKLVRRMPKVFLISGTLIPPGYTFYRGFSKTGALGPGGGGPLPPGQPGMIARGTSIVGIVDGTSNTLMVAEVAEPTVWTKPDEPEVDDKSPLPPLGGVFDKGFNTIFGDGSVRWLKLPLPEKTHRHLIMRNDGFPVDIP
jgi:hypothetical protein